MDFNKSPGRALRARKPTKSGSRQQALTPSDPRGAWAELTRSVGWPVTGRLTKSSFRRTTSDRPHATNIVDLLAMFAVVERIRTIRPVHLGHAVFALEKVRHR